MTVLCVPRLLWCLCHSITCISRNVFSIRLSNGSAWASSWTQAQSACLPYIIRQYQIILLLLCYRGNGLLEGFYIQQRRDPELTPCQRELKFDVLPVTPPRYVKSLVCMSVLKISGKFIRPTTVFCGTDLLYQTQNKIQMLMIYVWILIHTVGCPTSVLCGQVNQRC